MVKQKRRLPMAMATAAFLCCGMTFLCGTGEGRIGRAEEIPEVSQDVNETEEEISTRGVFTSLSLSIDGGDGKVWTTVKNDLTVFPSTVRVIVELYCSDEYQEKYENMTLVQRKSSEDLNMGKTITVEGATGGKQKYWQGRARYKVDNKAWKELNTGTGLFDANGKFIGIT